MRSWLIWLSLFLLTLSLGWYWLLSRDLVISRTEPDVKPAAELKKGE